MTYPLEEVLLLCLLAVLAGAEASPTSRGSERRRSSFCAGSGRFTMERPRTITSAIFLPPSMPRHSSAALWPGSRR